MFTFFPDVRVWVCLSDGCPVDSWMEMTHSCNTSLFSVCACAGVCVCACMNLCKKKGQLHYQQSFV